MKLIASFSALVLASSLLLGCNSAPPDTHDADIKALMDNEAQWNKDFAAKDAAKIAAHYTSDAVLFTPGETPLVGADAIKSAMGGMTSDPAFSLVITTKKAEAGKSSDIGYTTGTYVLKISDGAGKTVTDEGNYVTTYAHQADGSWKATYDCITTKVPQTPTASIPGAGAPAPTE
jgi:ketosteroid isomerase-like protein